MALEDSFENAYETLGLRDGGPSTSESDIKKAYRRLALQKHPDKNPDNPDAAQEFSRIQKAYDILCDSEARAALDEWLRVQSFRQQKTAFRDQKRRKMAEELERREKMSDFSTAENAAKVKLQQQIERLRQMAAQKEEDAYVERQKDVDRGNKVDERMFRTFKVNWKKDLGSSPDLVDIFSKFGRVEDVVVRESKKGKNSALIVMETQDSHSQILRANAERKLGDLKVTPLVTGQMYPMKGNAQTQEHVTLGEYRFPPNKRDTSVRLFPAAKSAAPFDVADKETRLGDFEAQVLGKLQRKRVAD